MHVKDFDYNLPEKQIAQFPPKERGATNLLVLDRKTGQVSHKKYVDIVDYIKPADVVVLNKTKVNNSRTYFLTPDTQKRVEVLFLDELKEHEGGEPGREYWYCLIGRAKMVEAGDELFNEEGVGLPIRVEKREGDGFIVSSDRGNVHLIFEQAGHVPLPPYMKREDVPEDKERYNTIFAKEEGSSAAPTASLNLTEDMLNRLRTKGVEIVEVELRVGWGTFAPIRSDEIEDHKLHKEYIVVTDEQEDLINERIRNGVEVWAFGTTVARTLESASEKESGIWEVDDFYGYTDLYIYPGYEWKIVDHLITNFHAPKSSLLVLVSAFADRETVLDAYNEALGKDYNFLSYGDSMLIL